MQRLFGTRPSVVRQCLGWEWLVEEWLCREEAAAGGRVPPPRHLPSVSAVERAPNRRVSKRRPTMGTPPASGDAGFVGL